MKKNIIFMTMTTAITMNTCPLRTRGPVHVVGVTSGVRRGRCG